MQQVWGVKCLLGGKEGEHRAAVGLGWDSPQHVWSWSRLTPGPGGDLLTASQAACPSRGLWVVAGASAERLTALARHVKLTASR